MMTTHASIQEFPFLRGNVDPNPQETLEIMASAENWPAGDKHFSDYDQASNFPARLGGLAGILEAQVGRDPANVGMDVAGGRNGIASQDLLREGFAGRMLVTNLSDKRAPQTRDVPGLDHLAGSLYEEETWQDMAAWRWQHAPEGLAFILHRPVGGLQHASAYFYEAAAHELIGWLQPGGVFFAQLPSIYETPQELPFSQRQAMFLRLARRPDVGRILFSPRPDFCPNPRSLLRSMVICKAR